MAYRRSSYLFFILTCCITFYQVHSRSIVHQQSHNNLHQHPPIFHKPKSFTHPKTQATQTTKIVHSKSTSTTTTRTTTTTTATSPLSIKPVSYQVHSWNDLNLWDNGFRQGMTHLKIDCNYQSQSFCSAQSQVTSNITNGCFVLSHDSPVSTRQYNSTDNVLSYIINNRHLFNTTDITSRKFMAFCFKLNDAIASSNVCNASNKIAVQWLASVTTLMNQVTDIINKYNLTLQIILDGQAATSDENSNCMAHLWEPFEKTYTGKPGTDVAMTNNVTLGYDRFSILDTMVPDNYEECLNNFNDWVKNNFDKYNNTNKITQPWLWWEPSSQECVRRLSLAYNESNFIHGFYFAINIDITRFKIYSGYNVWNEKMGLTLIEDDYKPKLGGSFDNTQLNRDDKKRNENDASLNNFAGGGSRLTAVTGIGEINNDKRAREEVHTGIDGKEKDEKGVMLNFTLNSYALTSFMNNNDGSDDIVLFSLASGYRLLSENGSIIENGSNSGNNTIGKLFVKYNFAQASEVVGNDLVISSWEDFIVDELKGKQLTSMNNGVITFSNGKSIVVICIATQHFDVSLISIYAQDNTFTMKNLVTNETAINQQHTSDNNGNKLGMGADNNVCGSNTIANGVFMELSSINNTQTAMILHQVFVCLSAANDNTTLFGIQSWYTTITIDNKNNQISLELPLEKLGDPIVIENVNNDEIEDVSITTVTATTMAKSKTRIKTTNTANQNVDRHKLQSETQAIVVWSTINREIYGTLVDLNSQITYNYNGKTANVKKKENRKTASVKITPKFLSVGSKPRLSVNDDNSEILMIHDNGYCWICEKHLKEAEPSTCSATPTSTRGVLMYTIGSVDQWIDKLSNDNNNYNNNDGGGDSNSSVISVCDEYLIHGMYDAGFYGYGTFIKDKNDNSAIASIHQSVAVGDKTNANLDVCGSALWRNDVVLDSWSI